MGYPIEPAHLGGVDRVPEIRLESPYHSDPVKASSVTPAEKATQTFTPSKPKLTPPQVTRGVNKSMGSMLASFVDSVEAKRQSAIATNLNRLESLATEHTRLMQEKVTKMMEHADEVMREDSWQYWKNIAYCLSSAASIVIGGAMVLTGDPTLMTAGTLLASSGITGLSAQGLEHAKVSPELTGTVALVSAGLGLSGAIFASYSDPTSTLRLISSMTQSAIALAYGAATFGQNHAQAEQQWLKGQLSRIQKDLKADDLDTQKIIQDTRITATKLNAAEAVSSSMRDYHRTVSRIAAASAA